ncbi:methyltransferase domain-containing protein [Nocardiopsis sp. CNR-923]|uniref:methyltransferase domain-containing protein n=1 Tax=Nocardiopsis sp. CNR-923 TaxID=1904965 RepID=UPI0021CCA8B7|nr:methyltransferase domain-containing protein [Nocardiopsis sp. CNR-923]
METGRRRGDRVRPRGAGLGGWRATPWGRLRYLLVAHTLGATLRPGRRSSVLDIGGGDGGDAIPLARQGHEVTIVDSARELLLRARDGAAAAGVDARVRTVHADLEELSADPLPGGIDAGYDLVLCHNVVQYSADVAATVATAVRMARRGGTVSVVAPNPAMDVLAAAVRRADPDAALDLLDADTVRSRTFGHDMHRVPCEAVESALREAGCPVTHRFGLRCVTDLIADEELKHDPAFFARLLRLETALCDREEFWHTARFWQLLAVRD